MNNADSRSSIKAKGTMRLRPLLLASAAAVTTGSYMDGPSTYEWQAAAGGGWAPTSTSLVSLEALYIDNDGDDSLALHAQFKTSFGND